MRKKYVISLILIFFLEFLPAQGFPPAHPIRLNNGMNGLFLKRTNSALFTAIIVVKTGLKNETPAINGVSHMLEHMTFNGTEAYGQDSLYSLIDKYGLYINAQTSEDYTSFMVMGANENFQKGMQIISDMLFRSNFPPHKFEKEKGIILAELEKDESSPYYMKELSVRKWLYENDIYGYPVLGTRESIKNISRTQLINYYKNYYTPDNMTVFLLGNLNAETVKITLQKYFGAEEKKSNSQKAHSFSGNIPTEPLVRKESGMIEYHVAEKAPNVSHRLFPLYYLLNETAFRNMREVSDGLPDTVKIHIQKITGEYHYHAYSGILEWTIQSKTPLSQEARAIIKNHIHQFVQKKISEKQLTDLIKNNWIAENILLDKILYYAFMKSQVLALAGPEFYFSYFPFIRRNKPHFANWMAQADFNQKPGEINWKIKEKDTHKLFSKTKTVGNNKIEIFEKKHEPVIIAQQDGTTNLTSIHILFKNKSSLEEKSHGIAEFSHFLYKRSTESHTLNQVDSLIQTHGFEFKWHDNYFIPFDDYYHSSEFGYIRLMTVAEYSPEAIKLLGELIQNPQVEMAELKRATSMFKMMAGKKAGSASEIFKYAYRRKLFGPQCGMAVPPYGNPAIVDSLTIDQLTRFLKKYTSNENLIISIISPYSPETIHSYITDSFKKSEAVNPVKLSEPSISGIKDSMTISSSKGQQFVYGKIFPTNLSQKQLQDVLLFNKMINDKINFVIREKKGLAYRMGARIDTIGNSTIWSVAGMIRPNSFKVVKHAIDSVLNTFSNVSLKKSDEIKYKALSKAKILRRFSSQENLTWLLGMQYYHGNRKAKTAGAIISEMLQKIENSSLLNGRNLFYNLLNSRNREIQFHTYRDSL